MILLRHAGLQEVPDALVDVALGQNLFAATERV
jgi:hypothetical protein